MKKHTAKKATKVKSAAKVPKPTKATIRPATDEQIAQGRKMLIAGTAVRPVGKPLPPGAKPPPPKPAAPSLLPPSAYPDNSVLMQLPLRHSDATHIEYRNPAKNLVIVSPANAYGDFRSFTEGTVRWGKLVGHDTFRGFDDEGAPMQNIQNVPKPPSAKPLPPGAKPPPPPSAKPAAKPAAAPRAPKPAGTGTTKPGVCSFIDDLIMKSDGKRTAEEIRDLTLAEFPDRDPVKTLSTVRIRPTHIRAKGLQPKPFKK